MHFHIRHPVTLAEKKRQDWIEEKNKLSAEYNLQILQYEEHLTFGLKNRNVTVEFVERRELYDRQEREFDELINNDEIIPFGVGGWIKRLKRILCQMKALVSYMNLLFLSP